ncbi:MAG: terpene cyclase/mutase family protein [Candidatus Jettenia caeni]|nr:terpene cyclase/mutase family protein [Candidatus Jettenia caeni]
MKKNFEAYIQKAKSQAQQFFENSYKEVSLNGSTQACGFPEMRGRTRLTEWGATSAAISGLKIIGFDSERLKSIFDKSKLWLLSKQNEDGSWEASGLKLAEATAGVLLDLNSINYDNSSHIDKAISFLDKCYKDGYYISTPRSIETPHIYTTYIVTKCLAKMHRLKNEKAIKSWVLSARTTKGIWGQTPDSNDETPIHTIFALFILNACGMPWKEMKIQFQKQIDWIKKSYMKQEYVYEEMQFEYDTLDEYGKQYGRLRLRHFTLPAVGNFFSRIFT